VGAHDTAASANSTDATPTSARRNVRDIVESKRNGARMTGVGDTGSAREAEAFSAEPRTLYVVATPIGNLRDVTLRALDILRSVDVILAEDTRVTATLLARYGIEARPRALHRHNEAREVERTRAEIAAGRSVALVSDAGTPAISDPGARLVRAVADDGYRVVPLPGASAMTAAVSAAGLDAESFAFIGFLPQQSKARREMLATFAPLPLALVFYEAPHRVADTARDLVHALGEHRMLTIARELTKTFETIARMPLADSPTWLAADANRRRGEFVLIVDAAPPRARADAISTDANALLDALLSELPPSRAARVASKVTGLPRDVLYAHALTLKPESS
jgi:16S rRNA (cytidine1402-2'-O)-methyltransferase